MFIRKALIVYLMLESRAEAGDEAPTFDDLVVFDDWVVDWRWLLGE
ncbi:MAG TPA: hypothetical protein VLA02_18280 [Reyranella sp.]|nr:hypothetical protein [Reyranella sp.]